MSLHSWNERENPGNAAITAPQTWACDGHGYCCHHYYSHRDDGQKLTKKLLADSLTSNNFQLDQQFN